MDWVSSYTHSQNVAIAVLPKISGLLSLLGSTYIIQDVMRDPSKRGRTYCRLLLGFSIYCWFCSLMVSLSTWPIPRNDPSAPLFAVGTTATCTLQGFFIQLGTANLVYSLGLTCYYFLILVHQWPDFKLQKLERWVHGLALLYGGGTAVAGIALQLYNNADLYCWISSLPQDCQGGNTARGDGVRCQRGHHAWIYRYVFFYGPLYVVVMGNTLIMGRVTWFVWSTEKKSRKYRQPGANNNMGQDKLREVALAVFWQSVHYVLAFYVTWIFPAAYRMLQTLNKDVPAGVVYGFCLLTPLQGLWNFTIYIRPQFRKYKQRSQAWIKKTIKASFSAAMVLEQPEVQQHGQPAQQEDQQEKPQEINVSPIVTERQVVQYPQEVPSSSELRQAWRYDPSFVLIKSQEECIGPPNHWKRPDTNPARRDSCVSEQEGA